MPLQWDLYATYYKINYKVQCRFHNVDDIVTTLGFLQIKLILRRYGLKHASINYSLCEKLIENGRWFWRKSYKKFTTEAIDRKRDKY